MGGPVDLAIETQVTALVNTESHVLLKPLVEPAWVGLGATRMNSLRGDRDQINRLTCARAG